MTTPTVLLCMIGFLGAIDIAYFHTWRGRLVLRPETRREAWIHVARGFCYAAQFAVVPNVQLRGGLYALAFALFGLDATIAALDVAEEPRARAAQGGLCGGEYAMHVLLSVLVGAFLCAYFTRSWHWLSQPTALTVGSTVPGALRILAGLMAVGSAATATVEALVLVEQTLPAPAPIHVRVRLDAPVERVWNLTQDHRVHPSWDHRFSKIVMRHEEEGEPHRAPLGTPDPRIQTGTVMRYEKRILGLTVRGFGRYKLHRPLRQSTFEFWSDDARSLIRRGAGLWRYTPLADGRTELATSFTYQVRWGILGRLIDRCMFRPLFQRYTEQSFRRLARRYFDAGDARVLGRDGRHPQRFESVAA